MWNASGRALVGADAVERVRPAQSVTDERSPMSRLLIAVNLPEPGIDGIPAGRGVIPPAIELFVLVQVRGVYERMKSVGLARTYAAAFGYTSDSLSS